MPEKTKLSMIFLITQSTCFKNYSMAPACARRKSFQLLYKHRTYRYLYTDSNQHIQHNKLKTHFVQISQDTRIFFSAIHEAMLLYEPKVLITKSLYISDESLHWSGARTCARFSRQINGYLEATEFVCQFHQVIICILECLDFQEGEGRRRKMQFSMPVLNQALLASNCYGIPWFIFLRGFDSFTAEQP